MSIRKDHFYHISISAGQYPTISNAVADVASFLKHLQRKCENNGYSCICYAGISENDHNAGKIRYDKHGKKAFVAYEGEETAAINPHIHIVLLANPGETIAKICCSYFSKRGIKAYHYRRDDSFITAIVYAMKQSEKCRTISCNVDRLHPLRVLDYCMIAEFTNIAIGGCCPVFKGLSDSFFHNPPVDHPFKLLVAEDLRKPQVAQGKTLYSW